MIYGPDIAGLKGKMTDKGPTKTTVVDIESAGESKRQSLYLDVFDVDGQLFILGVMKSMKYCFCSILNGKTAEDMSSATRSIINMVTSKGFEIARMEADPDPAFVKVKDTFGIPMELVGAGKHVPTAEREGRVVKERCRLLKASLPFVLPARLTKYMVLFVVTRLNLMPRATAGHSASPRERFTGKKLHYRKELELGFGEFAEVWSKPEISNSMQPRSISAIALYPVGNDQGSWYFYDLGNGSVFQRSQWVADARYSGEGTQRASRCRLQVRRQGQTRAKQQSLVERWRCPDREDCREPITRCPAIWTGW